MEFPVMDSNGKQSKTIELPADIFEVEVNNGLMHQAYVRQMANARLGTHKTQKRSEVSRTKAKWYRQKGTGRARHGSRNAPIFVGGGVAMGPVNRKYTKDMPKKMRRKAIRCALSALVRDEQLVIVESFDMPEPKTKEARDKIKALVGDESALVLFTDGQDNVQYSVNNLSNAQALRVNYLNIRDLFSYDKVIMPLDALEVITGIWGNGEEAK